MPYPYKQTNKESIIVWRGFMTKCGTEYDQKSQLPHCLLEEVAIICFEIHIMYCSQLPAMDLNWWQVNIISVNGLVPYKKNTYICKENILFKIFVWILKCWG